MSMESPIVSYLGRMRLESSSKQLPNEEEGGESSEEGGESSIYIRVLGIDQTHWYCIRSDSKTREKTVLEQELPAGISHEGASTCTAIGSTVYVFGGAEFWSWRPELKLGGDRALSSVYYIDSDRREYGWKAGQPMFKPRAWCYPVAVGNLIYVFHGHDFPTTELFDAELYDPTGKFSRVMNRIPFKTYILTAHAVFDHGKKILLYCDTNDAPITCYNVEEDTYTPFNVKLCGEKDEDEDEEEIQAVSEYGDEEEDEYKFEYDDKCGFGNNNEKKKEYQDRDKWNLCKIDDCNSLTCSDGVIYIAGLLFDSIVVAVDPTMDGFDLKRPMAKPVQGLSGLNWLPTPKLIMSISGIFLVSIGRARLALLWGIPEPNGVHGHCAKMSIFKKVVNTGEATFEALSVTHSVYYAPGHTLIQCLPVKTHWEKVDEKSIQKNVKKKKNKNKNKKNK